jgi:hypothetical protein
VLSGDDLDTAGGLAVTTVGSGDDGVLRRGNIFIIFRRKKKLKYQFGISVSHNLKFAIMALRKM